MEIIYTKQQICELTTRLKAKGKSIGFVPTMGFFHDGHLALMKEARKNHDYVITSIFVNPLQFGPNEDYDSYPRDIEHDASQAERVGVDILFVPNATEMYSNKMLMKLNMTGRTDVLCGKRRPGHFAGVVTVLTKLFHLVQPNAAYFGMKDAQQFAVVDALVRDLDFPIELVGLMTVREKNGLAKSSRNVRLTEKELEEAPAIYQALKEGKRLVVDGEKNPAIIVKEVTEMITTKTGGTIDYVELLRYPDLEKVTMVQGQVILAVAVQFEHARLIDNIIFTIDGETSS